MNVSGRFHLTYCSNIHPGETWAEVQASLASHLPQVRRHLGYEGPFGVGLRLSAQAAETLERPGALASFCEFLRDGNYYVFTINGFPYGSFHGTRVKEQVYLPDWRDERRLEYSNRLARLLAALMPGDLEGAVSTVPGAFKPALTGEDDVDRMTRVLLRHAGELVSIRERTGRTIVLALEPEPSCFIETTAEAIDYFRNRLFDPAVLERAAPPGLSVDDVRRHLGVCFDVCHMAVQFEDVRASVADLTAAGIRIAKVQISSGLRVRLDASCADARRVLAPFADDTYLHQVVERGASSVARYVDLPDAFEACEDRRESGAREWRVHFHLPVYLDRAPGFDTTHEQLEALLALLREQAFCASLEVETYTWSVLAPQYRTSDVSAAIARELAWVRDRLA